MTKLPKIHVIMPVYNCESYITSAVSSILSQPYKNIDILIIDDGSKDSSPAICDALSEKYQNISVIHKMNGGVSAARNDGINHILSICDIEKDYIAFCDADDLWGKDCLSQDLDTVLDQDMISFKSCSMSNDGKRCSAPHGECKSGEVAPGGCKAVWSYPFHFGAFLYKARLFKDYNIRFDTTLKYNEDKVLLMQLIYLADKIRHIPKMLYLYRKNPASAMHTRPRGIDYYIPLIEGWSRSDIAMRDFGNEQRGGMKVGRVMAMIYVVDMAKEHYQGFGKRRVLESVIKNHEIYNDFLALNRADVSEGDYSEYCLFKNHPCLFMLKHYLLGFVARIYKALTGIKFVSNYLYEREFVKDNDYI